MKAIYRVRYSGQQTTQLISLEVKDQAQAISMAVQLRKELKPVSKSEVELVCLGDLQEATSPFEAYELAMRGNELRIARTNKVDYEATYERIG